MGVELPLMLRGVDVPLLDFEAAFAARSAFRFCFARELIVEEKKNEKKRSELSAALLLFDFYFISRRKKICV